MGDRAGKFAVQNADLVLAAGTRISIRQVGYNWKTWAREAKVIMVDIDRAEMKKPTIHVDIPVWADVKVFFEAINRRRRKDSEPVSKAEEWKAQCIRWKTKYPVTLARHWKENGESANAFAFIRYLGECLPEGSHTAVSNGACCVIGHQNWLIKKGTRFIINNAIASMGYGLPAAIGLCIAGKRKETICLEGDGSIMMNLQELQTVITNNLPIKLFLINNKGYHSIRQTQSNLFSGRSKVGIGPESGDLSFPDYKKVARAFGYPYFCARSNAEMKEAVEKTLEYDGYVFCEIFTDTEQNWEPKSATKRLSDGRLISPPLEDLAPFLSREELAENMYIKMIEE